MVWKILWDSSSSPEPLTSDQWLNVPSPWWYRALAWAKFHVGQRTDWRPLEQRLSYPATFIYSYTSRRLYCQWPVKSILSLRGESCTVLRRYPRPEASEPSAERHRWPHPWVILWDRTSGQTEPVQKEHQCRLTRRWPITRQRHFKQEKSSAKDSTEPKPGLWFQTKLGKCVGQV